ncbi:response regulator transcription factor [Sphingobacterium cellulitidis]|uniref:response regulator transcription factor n=1 Tax=Sphingobacterium cellulitidis TaxID=1768011 RepID=UPI003C7A9178
MIERFFNKNNTVEALSDKELNQVLDYKEVIYAFERATYSSIYTIDYEKQTFEYVSENPLFLCGYSVDQVREMGYAFYYKNVIHEDLDLLIKINKIGFDFYENIPLQDRKLYTISYDFHLKSDYNKKILVNQKLTPVFLSDSGKIWKALCVVSLSTEKSAGNIKISKKGHNHISYYDLKIDKWKSLKSIVLTDRENEIIQLSIRGFTINDIASEIFVSPETVKFHRKKLFAKLDVNNMPEAIFYAANNKLL